MLLRDVQAGRFLKKYFGTEGGEETFGGINIASWKGLWNGKDLCVSGGSQGGFQSVGVAALDSDVSRVIINVPWFADVGGNTVSTRIQSTFRPQYADGLRYLDTALLAKRIVAPNVEITAGAGDPLCPMIAVQSIYNNLNVENASLRFRQGATHSGTNTVAIDFTQKKTKDSVTVPTDAFAGFDDGFEAFADAWYALTGRNAVKVESPLGFDESYGYNVFISLLDFANASGDMTYDEICSAYDMDVYAVGYTGELTALTDAHIANLTRAAESDSDVYLVAFGEDADDADALAETVALNLSGAMFNNQPKTDVDYKLVNKNGVVSSNVVLAEDLNNVKVYPLTVPYHAMKNSGLSTIYKTPVETGAENGIITLVGQGVEKKFTVIDASDVDAFGHDAGVEWLVNNGVLNIYGSEISSDTEYS